VVNAHDVNQNLLTAGKLAYHSAGESDILC